MKHSLKIYRFFLHSSLPKTKTQENINIKEEIEKIIKKFKEKIALEIIQKIYVSFENALDVKLTICLTNGSAYTAKYVKKGSKVLSEPTIEKA